MKSIAISALVLAAAAAPAAAPAPEPVPEPVPAPQLLLDTHPPEYYMTRYIDFANVPKVIYNPQYAHQEDKREAIFDWERWSSIMKSFPTHIPGQYNEGKPKQSLKPSANDNASDKRDQPTPVSSLLGHLTTVPQITPLVPPPPVSSLLGHVTNVPEDARKGWQPAPTPVSSLLGTVTLVPEDARKPWFTTHVMPRSPVSSLLGTVTNVPDAARKSWAPTPASSLLATVTIVPDDARKAWTTIATLPVDPMVTLFAAPTDNDNDNDNDAEEDDHDAPERRAVEAAVDFANYMSHLTIVPREMGKPITTVPIPAAYWTLLPEDLDAPRSVVPVFAAEATPYAPAQPEPSAAHAESKDEEDLKRYPSINF
ncbi:hypothetical protein ESCO_001470 [Escovopsis weberi]|uniref:Uncharacterized protein n=1 Tax=Escovopsis weberi TaxID=150374 RepID=A0A0M8N8I5_ESCWE|nr:hypothetical protein ESCO_001470 [Escovopsis weberi]